MVAYFKGTGICLHGKSDEARPNPEARYAKEEGTAMFWLCGM
jgi:hypothetical protein